MRLLGSLRSEDELTILKRDGEALRESEACRLAFGDSARASVAGGTIKEHTVLDL
jgi:hypothetical protein